MIKLILYMSSLFINNKFLLLFITVVINSDICISGVCISSINLKKLYPNSKKN